MRLLIADDHPLFRAALRQTVQHMLPDADLLEAQSIDQASAQLSAHADLDLVLLDLNMPGGPGLLGLKTLRAKHPSVAVAIVSAIDDPAVMRRAIEAGAVAFIPKSATPEQISEALDAVFRLETWLPPSAAPDRANPCEPSLALLTTQQQRVLELVALGRLNKQIADTLGVQERTIKAHLAAIFIKLGVRNRTQASVLYQRLAG